MKIKELKASPCRWLWRSGLLLISFILGGLSSGYLCYQQGLRPLAKELKPVVIDINLGQSPRQIAEFLQNKKIIRSAKAFRIYLRLFHQQKSLKAGRYELSAGSSTPEIIKKIIEGSVQTIKVTFYPGATLTDHTTLESAKKLDVLTALRKAGFSEVVVTQALAKKYQHPLFENFPENAGLEGYVFGETYYFNYGVSVEDILMTTFQEFYKTLQTNNLIEKFKQRGLNLYQAITLASIVEKEAGGTQDHARIAQVFYKRLELGMNLGSDVTYQYIADKLGVARDVNLDSPYNTRRYAGLPPGPIAVPGLRALKAVAEPAEGDDLFFVSGDDDITYFAKTEIEHNNNVKKYCLVKCASY